MVLLNSYNPSSPPLFFSSPPLLLLLLFLQAGETVLSALSGCKLLREMSKLESETETKLSMKELAQRFENMAHGETSGVPSPKCLLSLSSSLVLSL